MPSTRKVVKRKPRFAANSLVLQAALGGRWDEVQELISWPPWLPFLPIDFRDEEMMAPMDDHRRQGIMELWAPIQEAIEEYEADEAGSKGATGATG